MLCLNVIILASLAADPAAGDLKLMAGTWTATSYVVDGKEWPKEKLATLRLIVKGADGNELILGDQKFFGSYSLDESATPRTIDITLTEGPEKGKKKLGLYELKGDSLRLCVGPLGGARPKAFESKPGSGVWLEDWSRAKAGAARGKKPSPGNTDDMWVTSPVPTLPTNVTHHTFRSASMKRDVGYCIYLPPGYDKNKDRRYPVIYHLHGANGNETRSVYSASVLHEGIIAGKLPDIIMVFPNGGRSTMYQDSGDGRFMAETMMVKELIPHVDSTYRTIADRKARCIEGFSMGGRGATHLAMKYPELFGSLFNQSGNVYHVSDAAQLPNAYLGSDPERLKANDPYLNLAKNLDFIKANLRIQVACGTADPDHIVTVREYHAALTKAGVPHRYFEVEGLDHNQKKMIDSRKETWFDFHVESLK